MLASYLLCRLVWRLCYHRLHNGYLRGLQCIIKINLDQHDQSQINHPILYVGIRTSIVAKDECFRTQTLSNSEMGLQVTHVGVRYRLQLVVEAFTRVAEAVRTTWAAGYETLPALDHRDAISETDLLHWQSWKTNRAEKTIRKCWRLWKRVRMAHPFSIPRDTTEG